MSEPIRILHVFAEMNRGGAETMVMNLYRHIDRTKIQFDFVVHTKEKCTFDDEINFLGGIIYRVPKYSGKNHITYKKALEKIAKDHPEHSIVHGHVRSTAAIYLNIFKKYGRCTISHSHSTSSGRGIISIVKNLMQYRIKYISDYFFACSISAGNWLFGVKVTTSNRFFIIRNAIEIDDFKFNEQKREEIRKKLNISKKFVIGHVGRFHESKNHSFIIDVFKKIYEKNTSSVLLLVGDGKIRKNIYDKVLENKLNDNIIFTGERNDVADLLQGMDIFLFPSVYEGLGIVVVEAQTSGLKCIVSDRVPDDAIVTDLVCRVSLSESVDNWSEKILGNSNYNRQDVTKIIKAAGYDINDTVEWLQNFYLSHSKITKKSKS
jgi:glycosyltransferase involved in cell wall biosynthesis